MRNLQQGIPEGPELATAPTGTQPSVEASAENEQGTSDEEEGVRVSREELCAPRPL